MPGDSRGGGGGVRRYEDNRHGGSKGGGGGGGSRNQDRRGPKKDRYIGGGGGHPGSEEFGEGSGGGGFNHRGGDEGGGRGPGGGDHGPGGHGGFHHLHQPKYEVGEDGLPLNPNKAKFTGRCRLFVGNLAKDMAEAEFKALFQPYGELAECFVSEKGFGFATLDTRMNAEKAKAELDGKEVNGRAIRVRFATHNAAVRVKEIPAYVSNEILFQALSVFGDVERAVHIVDERGRPTGEGIVEFARRPGASDCLRRVAEGVFLLTTSPKPVIVEQMEQRDEEDGLMERMVPRNNQFLREREQPPRFAAPGSFEYVFGNRWKELYQEEKRRRELLEQELQEARERLVSEMDLAYQEYQADLMREDLRRRQQELERLEASRAERIEQLRQIRARDTVPPGGYGGGGGFPGGDRHLPPPFGTGSGDPFNRQPPVSRSEDRRGGGGGGGEEAMMGGGGRGGPPNHGGMQPPPDDNLVHGVQKLLSMFKSESGASPGGPPPGFPGMGQEFPGGGMSNMPPPALYGNQEFMHGGMPPMFSQDTPPPGFGGNRGGPIQPGMMGNNGRPNEMERGGPPGNKRRRH